jgi:hypothetical protein
MAYIDPGTGSILFSILIGFAAAFYFLARAALVKIKFLFTGKAASASDRYIPIVIYNEGRQYWNVFKPILYEFEKRKIKVEYLTSAGDDPFFKESFVYITGSYINEGNKAFMRLNFLRAGVCLMTTPGLEVYQLKRSKGVKHYAHILHDTGDATCYRLFGIDWFDSILLSGEYQKKDIRELERIRETPVKNLAVIGSSYLDVLAEKKKDLPPEKDHLFTVLVSPSWGRGALLSVFGERLLDPLAETGWRIIIRPHPQSLRSEKDILERLEKKYKNNFVWDFEAENLSSLSRSDVMISDYSGIIFDYVFLFERPVIYAGSHFDMEMYDASDLDHIPWRFEVVKSFGVELKDEQLKNIRDLVTAAVNNKQLSEAARKAKETAWQHIGESGKLAVDFLISKGNL